MRFLAVAALVAVIGATPSADRMPSLQYLVGTWACTYQPKGAPAGTYTATYAYGVGGALMRETDAYNGGGGDVDLYTFDPKAQEWTSTVVTSYRTTTVFQAHDQGVDRKVWHSVYPDATMTLTFNKVSATEYMLAFTQTVNGKMQSSADHCKKKS